MPTSSITRLVDLCVRRPWWTIVLALALAVGAGIYAARHFAMHTDVRDLLSPDLPWSRRAEQYMHDFPQRNILVVLDAPTAEGAEQAATKLADALAAQPDRFRAVSHPGSGSFFEQNGLLFLSTEEVRRIADGLSRADALLGTLASDPSLRGALDALSLVLVGAERGEIKVDDTARPLTMAANAAEAALAGRPASFSWRALANGEAPDARDLRRFLQVEPVLDFTALQPGRAATDAIAQTAAHLKLDQAYQVRVRQTGIIPINDDEFGTIKHNAELNAALTLLALLIILWLALHSFRIIFAAAVSLFVGLAISTAVGLFLVGALNLISVAFFVLFVGLGVDFAIQFSVRYRAERHDHADLRAALHSAAMKAGGPLALAAIATAVGFASFLPTSYRGLSELGAIAGAGMIIAFLTSITLLPALLAVLKPPGEPHPVGFAALAPLDRFMERHRMPIVVSTLAAVTLAAPLLYFLPFDFNPMHLRSPKVESMATYIDIGSDPQTGANAIDIVASDLTTADALARRIAALPQVAQVRTLSNLVPRDQDEKLQLIRETAAAVDESLNPAELEKPPTDQENTDALTATAESLTKAAGNEQGPGAEAARRLSDLLTQLAEADPTAREQIASAIVQPLRFSLDQLRSELKAQPVSIEGIPDDLRREWMTPDGRARVEVLPKGDPEDPQTLRNFVQAVLAVEANAIGPAVVLVEAGNTVVHAFILSGVFALSAIFVLLWITLRRIGDVLLTLVPLLVAGLVTLELCVIFDLPLNFANILALPLLLGVGVAFKIYYIVAWRAGKTQLLQSSLTRAVLFSGMTTATAFGSLWMSSHPGTSSMGKLMALSLLCTMAAAVLFQPVLMGPPRAKAQA
jgi:hopanoid biosynthesis associated RND transporter like protein HpnN